MEDRSYHPGELPTGPAPLAGQQVGIEVAGVPPVKDTHVSIRNPNHPKHEAFVRLRSEATKAMAGRRWHEGAVAITITLRSDALDRSLTDYLGGIMDTLGGSHGDTFTYLPIVYQDDCQVCEARVKFEENATTGYSVEISFE